MKNSHKESLVFAICGLLLILGCILCACLIPSFLGAVMAATLLGMVGIAAIIAALIN